jgi:hypothetical protein
VSRFTPTRDRPDSVARSVLVRVVGVPRRSLEPALSLSLSLSLSVDARSK